MIYIYIYIVNYDKAVGAAKLIVAVYDSENRLIGASMTDTEGLEKYKGTAKPYNIECTADDTANADKESGTTIEWFTSKDTSANKNRELKKNGCDKRR